MPQTRSILFAPETAAVLAVAIVYALCAMHATGEGEDLAFLERMIWLMPVVLVAAVFATILAPGARSRVWLLRATLASVVALVAGALRIVEGFGSGARGQDAAIIVAVTVGVLVASLGLAITGAMVLAHERPRFAQWLRRRRFSSAVLTLLAALPIGFVLVIAVAFALGVLGGLWSALAG